MRECHILRPELFALVEPLRRLLAGFLAPKRTAEVQLTLVDQGPDVLLKAVSPEGLAAIEALTAFASGQGLVRLSVDHGLGSETLFEPGPATISLAGIPVAFPVGAFLQATEDGEAALVRAVQEALKGAPRIADLFAGLGTFALALRAVYAAEASRDAAARGGPGPRLHHHRRGGDAGGAGGRANPGVDRPRARARGAEAGRARRRHGGRRMSLPPDLPLFAAEPRGLCSPKGELIVLGEWRFVGA
jgi:23S rRNA (uracil1939-C5)-methyltransferase